MIQIQDPVDPVSSRGASERKEWAAQHSVEMLEISVVKRVVVFFFFKENV